MRLLVYVNLVVGIWLLASPLLLGETADTALFWNNEVIGMILLVVTGIVGFSVPRKNGEEPLSRVERRREG